MAEYAFATLRGMAMMGGQVKIEHSERSRQSVSPTDAVVFILKSSALAYLEIESAVPKQDDADNSLEFELDRGSVEFDFKLSQKPYSLTINALSALAMNRPVFFREAAVCLARRAVHPPAYVDGGDMSSGAILAIASQLRASCLTLLRNASSVTTSASDILHKALLALDMEIQADKALNMAIQTNELKTAGRAARNQAKMFYEWDATESDRRSTKRQKETDDALAKLRAAKRQKGLGGGIQLPTSMSDAIDLVLLNLVHLPKTKPSATLTQNTASSDQVSLEFIVDAILTNGASLLREEGRWYDRNGGAAWTVDLAATNVYELSPKLMETLESVAEGPIKNGTEFENVRKRDALFLDQCSASASDAFGRILTTASSTRSKSLQALGNQLASRLAFTLKGVHPVGDFARSSSIAKSIAAIYSNHEMADEAKSLSEFVDSYPLVASSISAAIVNPENSDYAASHNSIGSEILNEAFLQDSFAEATENEPFQKYDMALDMCVASAVYSSRLASEKPNDSNRKGFAARAVSDLQKYIAILPRLTERSLILMCKGLCDPEETARKAKLDSNSSTAHAAKIAAEKRATAVLVILRDVAFQRDTNNIRKCAVDCAVALASGRFHCSASVHDKATKLVMNVLFAKNEFFANLVACAVCSDLEIAASLAIGQHDAINAANMEAHTRDDSTSKNPLAPRSDTEKLVLEQMKRFTVLAMALCVRQPEMIQRLFQLSCQDKADVLSKAVRSNMAKLAKAVAAKHGVALMALRVAEMCGPNETPMLLAFLENLVSGTDKTPQSEEMIEACFKIQESKRDHDGKTDPRYIIPVVSAMKRKDLVERLPEFVAADDNVFLAALVRMGDRVGRLALLFREEQDPQKPMLLGMTLCEQLVFLHRLDFSSHGLPQKRYLAAIKLCLEEQTVFSDRVLMSAIDEMSGQFLSGALPLPLAFMRTIILVLMKFDSIHAWVSHVLLPRLVEGKIWNDPRQWEGWMRCAHMLEQSGDPNVNSVEAINKLPAEQLAQYRSKWSEAR
jgi:symplekin